MIYYLIFLFILILLISLDITGGDPQSYKKARILMYHSIGEHIKNEKHNKWRVKTNYF